MSKRNERKRNNRMPRKQRQGRARAKVNAYYNEFRKACAKYLIRMGDKQVTLQDIMQSHEMISAALNLEKRKPEEISLIENGLKMFCKELLAENKEKLSNDS